MPQMANITVKASNGTTDVVYNAQTPSSGDKVAARWAVELAHAIPAFRPILTMRTQDNGPKTARAVDIELSFPIIVTENSVDRKAATVPIKVHATLPTNVSSVAVKEPIYQIGNLVSAALIRAAMEAGFAPT